LPAGVFTPAGFFVGGLQRLQTPDERAVRAFWQRSATFMVIAGCLGES
jgi:hypothetical protein